MDPQLPPVVPHLRVVRVAADGVIERRREPAQQWPRLGFTGAQGSPQRIHRHQKALARCQPVVVRSLSEHEHADGVQLPGPGPRPEDQREAPERQGERAVEHQGALEVRERGIELQSPVELLASQEGLDGGERPRAE